MEYSIQVNGIPWWRGAKYVKLVVGCSLLVDVSVHGGMLTMAGSWWGEKVITPNFGLPDYLMFMIADFLYFALLLNIILWKVPLFLFLFFLDTEKCLFESDKISLYLFRAYSLFSAQMLWALYIYIYIYMFVKIVPLIFVIDLNYKSLIAV